MTGDARRDEARAIPIAEIADRLGIAGLNGPARGERVGPCPVCGGRDRFGINTRSGVWLCRRCDAGGDGIALVQHVRACDFRAALDFLVGEGPAAIDPAELERRRRRRAAEERTRAAAEARSRARAIDEARAIWGAAQPAAGSPVEAYLAGRGIAFPGGLPPTLRFLPDHPAIKTVGGRALELHRGPCMIAAIQDAGGRVTAVHQTWIDAGHAGRKAAIAYPDGTAAPAKMVRGSKKGGAIRLTPAAELMVMGEGIETTASILAAGALPGAAFWAGVDLGNMGGKQIKVPGRRYSGEPDLDDARAFVPPAGVRRLAFLQDGDSDPVATRAKLLAGARRAMAARPGLRAVIIPAEPGKDFNDMWQELNRHE